jgi:hypothetical protein
LCASIPKSKIFFNQNYGFWKLVIESISILPVFQISYLAVSGQLESRHIRHHKEPENRKRRSLNPHFLKGFKLGQKVDIYMLFIKIDIRCCGS